MTDTGIEDLFPFYALGSLSESERARVDAYVAANGDARARLDEMLHAATVLHYAVEPVDPPLPVKTQLMDRVRADAQPRSVRAAPRAQPVRRSWLDGLRLRPALPILAGAAVVLALLIGAWALSLNSEVAHLRGEVAALKQELMAQTEALAQLSTANLQSMAIDGTEHQPAAHGRLVADPGGSSAVLIVSGLKPLDSGQTYQFWLIRGDTPVSAGVFAIDEQGNAVVKVAADAAVGSFDAMGVSIEPAGGSAQPTGDIVMLGSLS